jgi:predicted phosphoribosyltransferase
MQKVINVVAAGTFVLALANTAVIVLAFTRGPSIVKKQISELKLELTKTILEQVPVPEMPEMPKLPTETGPAIPLP